MGLGELCYILVQKRIDFVGLSARLQTEKNTAANEAEKQR
jgi:hypothetical protein